jgi:hypothetical protein
MVKIMKNIVLLIVFLAFSLGAGAQSIIDNLYDKYSSTEGYTSVYISKYMFEMFKSNEKDIQMQDEMEQAISKLDCIKILTRDDDPSTSAPVSLYSEIMKVIPSSTYKEIMVVKEGGQNVNMYVKENNDKVAELLMVIGGGDEDVLISIQGDIDMNSISKIGASMNIEGMENLENIEP